jgi:hypothetical protein
VQNVTFDAALGILRLSHKYLIEGLQQGIKQQLLEDWPLQHSDYIARRKYLGLKGYRIHQAMKLIETAQRFQVNELLPTAFYELACVWRTQWKEIVGVLSPENVIRLCLGRERAAQRLQEFTSGNEDLLMWKSSPSITVFQHRTAFGRCQRHPPSYPSTYCSEGFSALRGQLGMVLLDGLFAIPAIRGITHDDSEISACNSCKDWFMDILKNKVQEIWEYIPTDFDLPEIDPELYSESTIKKM